MERFTVRIATPADREKALSRIFQAVLLSPVALVTTVSKRAGYTPKSVIVVGLADPDDKEFVDDMVELQPDRVLGTYQYDGNHRRMLTMLAEDLQEAARGMGVD